MGARIKNILMVWSKDKGWLNEWEKGLIMVGWWGVRINDGWMVGSKD